MKKKALWILGIVFLVISLSGCKVIETKKTENSTPVTLETPSGVIHGLEYDGVYRYKGIPYAKPPIKELRFAPTQPVEPWTKPLDCQEFGSTAYQAEPYEDLSMSEDCLNLNVWTPAKPQSKEKLPVYVFIHGGGYASGTGAKSLYDGSNFSKNGIVSITINYRLNALGYFASQETLNNYGTTGNWGHLDQIEALKWVQKNIEAFGGDPNNVTIGGESAGSFSVSTLISSPLSKGLFQKAIMESGSILSIGSFSYKGKGNLERSIDVSNGLGNVFSAKDDPAGLEKLRQVDPGALSAFSEFNADQMTTEAFSMWPVFDGKVLPKDPAKELKNGNMNKVKLLMGYNTDEATIFMKETISEGDYIMLVNKIFTGEKAQKVLERFPIDEAHSPGERARELITLANFRVGMKTYADALASSGQDVYAYHFDYPMPLMEGIGLGAFHAYEMPFVFGNNLKILNLDDYGKKLAEEMHLTWVNFIKNGDPNQGESLPLEVSWPKYTTEKKEVLRFGDQTETEKLPQLEDLEFLETIMFWNDPYYY